jgi:hypothetical protein
LTIPLKRERERERQSKDTDMKYEWQLKLHPPRLKNCLDLINLKTLHCGYNAKIPNWLGVSCKFFGNEKKKKKKNNSLWAIRTWSTTWGNMSQSWSSPRAHLVGKVWHLNIVQLMNLSQLKGSSEINLVSW